MLGDSAPVRGTVTLGLSQRHRQVQMHVTVVKHHQPTIRNKNGPIPEVKHFNLNDFPPTSRYLALHPVFKLVDNYLGTRINPAMRRVNNDSTKKSTLPNVNTSGYAKCCKQDRVRTNMRNISSRNSLRLSLNESRCKDKPLTEIHAIESTRTRPASDMYVEQLKSEIKNCIAKCCQEGNQDEYVRKLKEELIVSRASDEARNTINELKNEIQDYRRLQTRHKCAAIICGERAKKEVGRGAPEPVQQVDQPTVQEKSDLDRYCKRKESISSSVPSQANFEEKLEEANDLIEKVRKTLKDIAVQQKTVKPKNGLYTLSQSRCIEDNCIATVANLLKDIDTQNKEIIQKLPKLVDKEQQDKQKKVAEELRQKLEAELLKQKEEECQRQIEEALRKQKEELRIKMEEELEKQKQEILREKQKQEIVWKKQVEQQQGDNIEIEKTDENLEEDMKSLVLETVDNVINRTQLEAGDAKDVVEDRMEWIPVNSDKDIIIRKTTSFNDSSCTCSVSENAEDQNKSESSIADVQNSGISSSGPSTDVEIANPASGTFFVRRPPMEPVPEEPEIAEPEEPERAEPEDQVDVVPVASFKVLETEEKTEPRPPKPKLCVQTLPPVSIRSGLVIQRTLNLTIKPTGSVANDVGVDRSNIGYREIKEEWEEDPVVPIKCPEECKDTEGNCKYKVLEDMMLTNNQKLKNEQPPSNILTEEALMLLKSYQILDQHKQRSESSTTSAANLSYKFFKYMPQQTLDRSLASSMASVSCKQPNAVVEKSVSNVVGPEPNPLLDDSLTGLRNPFEIGFYATKSTQCSGTNLATTSSDGDNFVEGYKTEWAEPESEMDRRQLEEEEVEVPVRDLPVISSEASSSKRRVSLAVSRGLREMLGVELEETPSESEERKVEQEVAMKSILSQKSMVAAAEEVKKTSTSSSSTEFSAVSNGFSGKKKRVSTTSSSSSSMFDIKDKRASGQSDGSKLPRRNKQSVGQYAILKTMVQPEKPKETERKEENEPKDTIKKKKSKKEPTDKPKMVDENLQTSFLSASGSTTPRSSVSGEQVNTIKSFIQGLTGGSQEDIAKMRSVPSLKNKTPSKALKAESTSMNKSEVKPPQEAKQIAKGSEYEVAKEEELSLLDYSGTVMNQNDEAADVIMGDVKDSKIEENYTKPKDFHKFAKETLSARRRSRQESTVLTLIETRKHHKSLDRGEGNNQKTLPFYRRVFVRHNSLNHSQSDPMPVDNSVSEGEINCKCSISSGEVHVCKQMTERRNKLLKKHPESDKRSLRESPITIARQRTQYNNWITSHLQKHKHRCVCDDFSFASSIDTSK